MHTVIRRSLTVGVAMAGVGIVAFAPSVMVPDNEIRIPAPQPVTTAVTPTASWDTYAAILLEGAAATVGQSVDALFNQSPALLAEAMANWPIAETELAYSQIANAALAPLMPLATGAFTDAVTEVLARSLPGLRDEIEQLPAVVEYSAVRLVGPLVSAIAAAGAAHAEIYRATTTGDLAPFFEAVVRAPGLVIDGLLHGGYGDIAPLLPDSVGPVAPPGLLTPWHADRKPATVRHEATEERADRASVAGERPAKSARATRSSAAEAEDDATPTSLSSAASARKKPETSGVSRADTAARGEKGEKRARGTARGSARE